MTEMIQRGRSGFADRQQLYKPTTWVRRGFAVPCRARFELIECGLTVMRCAAGIQRIPGDPDHLSTTTNRDAHIDAEPLLRAEFFAQIIPIPSVSEVG